MISFLLFAVLFHVVSWREPVKSLEDGREGGCIVEAAGIHHLGDVHLLVG